MSGRTSAVLEDREATLTCQSDPGNMADRYDAKADLWSVGTIFFELLTGRPPFTGANYLDLTRNILSREAAIPPQVSSLSPSSIPPPLLPS